MRLNALSKSVFLFCNRNHKLLKVIFWNRTGFWTTQERLERATWLRFTGKQIMKLINYMTLSIS